jgi:ParB family chromosome partitioning protein
MGQQALFDPVMIKKWGNCEPKSGCFRGHFPRHFFDSMTAFVNGFSFEGDVLICQDSQPQIYRYIRLTHLIPEILELVDNSVLKDQEMLQIAMRPAVELSYLRKEEQADLFAIMDEMDCTPSHAQAIKMRQMSEAKTGGERLAKDALVSIMKEEKPNQKEQFKIPKEKISRFFAPGTPTQKIEDTIVKALELYRKRQRSLER